VDQAAEGAEGRGLEHEPPGVNIIKLSFKIVLTEQNKLERLPLAGLSSLVG